MPCRLMTLLALFGIPCFARGEIANQCKLNAVPLTAVKLQDAFWTPRLETNRTATLPHNLQYCRKTGRIDNFAKAAGLMEGKYVGYYFNDSDLYKVIEGAAYSLAAHPDPKLEKEIDEIIAKIAAAQRPDGYLNSYFTLTAPEKRWTDIRSKHELYCAGHLIEAAAAYFAATGKRSLLDAAERFVDHIDGVFGPDKRREPPGHEEIELALVKLYRLTGKEKYLRLAGFFIDARGDASRPQRWGPELQDHLPVRRQDELCGHAVRAMYLCSGATDVAAHTGDESLLGAMDRLWTDMTQRKMYVTGGIGARHKTESFGDAYELPNDTAYCETCAAIGIAFWAHRMNLMHADARYADIMERAMYNGVLSGVSLDGKRFFYVNPLASDGKHHRKPYYDCACCPTNVVRFLPALPGCLYAVSNDRKAAIYVNLYAASEADVPLSGGKVRLAQQTKYPWDGKVLLNVSPDQPATFALNLRIPDWCRGAKLSVGGEPVAPLNVEKGYARLEREWRPGDTVELDLPMPIERIEANPRVKADLGRVAIRRGPIVYCFEAADNGKSVNNITLPIDPRFTAEYRGDLLGGATLITGVAQDGRKIVAVPYNVWDNREPGEMAVWVRQEGKPPAPDVDDPSWNNILYRPLAPDALGAPAR